MVLEYGSTLFSASRDAFLLYVTVAAGPFHQWLSGQLYGVYSLLTLAGPTRAIEILRSDCTIFFFLDLALLNGDGTQCQLLGLKRSHFSEIACYIWKRLLVWRC